MRTSGIIYVNSDGVIQLHKNIIESQTVFDGSILFGIYYPRSKSDDESIEKTDFMITPIPFKHWKCTGRLIMKLEKQSTSIPIITEFLKQNGISIAHSVSNRSAHRYSTWDLHISFDSLINKELTYLDNKSYYEETYFEMGKLSKLLVNEFGDKGKKLLWVDKKDIDLINPLISSVNTGLHFFHNITNKRIENAKDLDTQTLYKPFSLRYTNGNIVSNSGKKIGNILAIADKRDENQRQLPTIGFIESESHYLNYRIRIIPREKLTFIYKISIYYERKGTSSSTTRGLLNFLMNQLNSSVKVWMSYNQLYECRDNYGSGRINMFIETPKNFNDQISFMEHFKNLIVRLNKENKPKELEHIQFWPKILPVYPNYIRKHFKDQREYLKNRKKDVFISYSSRDDKHAERIRKKLEENGLSVFKADKEMKSGDLFNEKIRIGLNNCREVCLLYSKSSKNSSYVTTEWGAAWFMGKKIITMYLDMTEDDALQSDQRLTQTQMMRFDVDNLPFYCEEVMQRRLEYYLNTDKYEYYN
ncbi:toll/interleukin-1 receptor domain-containing protein [Ascidiimonas sp. W6]|uniref:toll/interleukin-1 receptor domain-containing protein n=1 Tax=Ascidiimonas meishanensis TaxID=3128903 RepID=UPI0030EC7FB4